MLDIGEDSKESLIKSDNFPKRLFIQPNTEEKLQRKAL